jgi:hypothetical protein
VRSSRSLHRSALILQIVISSDSTSLPGVTTSSPNSESLSVTTPPCFRPTCLTQSLGSETVSVEWPTRWTFLISNLFHFGQIFLGDSWTKRRLKDVALLYISKRLYIEKGLESFRAIKSKKTDFERIRKPRNMLLMKESSCLWPEMNASMVHLSPEPQ